MQVKHWLNRVNKLFGKQKFTSLFTKQTKICREAFINFHRNRNCLHLYLKDISSHAVPCLVLLNPHISICFKNIRCGRQAKKYCLIVTPKKKKRKMNEMQISFCVKSIAELHFEAPGAKTLGMSPAALNISN